MVDSACKIPAGRPSSVRASRHHALSPRFATLRARSLSPDTPLKGPSRVPAAGASHAGTPSRPTRGVEKPIAPTSGPGLVQHSDSPLAGSGSRAASELGSDESLIVAGCRLPVAGRLFLSPGTPRRGRLADDYVGQPAAPSPGSGGEKPRPALPTRVRPAPRSIPSGLTAGSARRGAVATVAEAIHPAENGLAMEANAFRHGWTRSATVVDALMPSREGLDPRCDGLPWGSIRLSPGRARAGRA
jgi:hypothetical protein